MQLGTGVYHAGPGFITGLSVDLPIGSYIMEKYRDSNLIDEYEELLESLEIRLTNRLNLVKKNDGLYTYWLAEEYHLGMSFRYRIKEIRAYIRYFLISAMLLSNLAFSIHGKIIFFDKTYVVGQITKIDEAKIHVIPMGFDTSEGILVANVDTLRLEDGKIAVLNSSVKFFYQNGKLTENNEDWQMNMMILNMIKIYPHLMIVINTKGKKRQIKHIIKYLFSEPEPQL